MPSAVSSQDPAIEEASVICDNLESLAGALSFDRSLSRCVRQEVEDHLWEAVAADPIGNRFERSGARSRISAIRMSSQPSSQLSRLRSRRGELALRSFW
jgi:hypothetical protein